jgi:response regulator RpfG family c-di-GMP phosphodiesterase
MKETILVVDDSISTLHHTAALLKEHGVQVLETLCPQTAIEIVKSHQIAVVVSDYYMPQMTGNELLQRIKETSPTTVRILMTSSGNLSTALTAINKGEVFRFIRKPYEDKEMIEAVRHGIRRFRELEAMRVEDERILCSLAEAIELKDPYTKGHCERVAHYALLLAKELDLSLEMQRDIKFGSWLHDCGKIGIPETILNANRSLEDGEMQVVTMHPNWGAQVVENARFSQAVLNIVRYHHEHFDGTGYPEGLQNNNIPLEARIVAIADVFDAISSDRPYRQKISLPDAIELIQDLRSKKFDPDLVDLFVNVIKRSPELVAPEIRNKEK